jgi:hypothetical protein
LNLSLSSSAKACWRRLERGSGQGHFFTDGGGFGLTSMPPFSFTARGAYLGPLADVLPQWIVSRGNANLIFCVQGVTLPISRKGSGGAATGQEQ